MNELIYLKSNIASNNSLNENNSYLLDLLLKIPICGDDIMFSDPCSYDKLLDVA